MLLFYTHVGFYRAWSGIEHSCPAGTTLVTGYWRLLRRRRGMYAKTYQCFIQCIIHSSCTTW